MQLYLCEKPSQASDLARVLGASERKDGYFKGGNIIVTFAVGHVLHQAEPEAYGEAYCGLWRLEPLPVLPSPWQMVPDPKTEGQLKVVVMLLRQADEVVIATDADREGEVIARSILSHAAYRGPMRRLWVSDSTPAGLRKAIAQMRPASQYEGLYASGLGRGRADWVSGMNLTRALSVAFAPRGVTLNFGRVQTPTLALVVRRERAIQGFKPKPYFAIQAEFLLGSATVSVPMRWQGQPGQLDAAGHLVDKTIAETVVQRVAQQTGTVTSVDKQAQRELAPLLYDLGALQRECSSRFGMSPDKTLATVQSLYEKHKLLTYPRTDCQYISEEMYPDAPKVLAAIARALPELSGTVASLGANGAPLRSPTRVFNSAKVAAAAHHAIIPTTGGQLPASGLAGAEADVYNLVARRYLAQLLPDHTFDETRVYVDSGGEAFVAIGRVTTEPGWKRLYPKATPTESTPAKSTRSRKAAVAEKDADNEASEAATVDLPAVSVGDTARNTRAAFEQKQTLPPKRYTEATLLSAMEAIDKEIDDPRLAAVMKNKEKAGIGTSATRSDVLKRLFMGDYFAKQKQSVVPTEKGMTLIALLERMCPALVDLALTAIWESALAEVESGQMQLDAFESRINQFVTQQVELVKQGKAAGVSFTFPEVTTPSPAPRRASSQSAASSPTPKAPGKTKAPQTVGEVCPSCGKGQLTQRSMKDGRPFMGCTAFPVCRHFAWIIA